MLKTLKTLVLLTTISCGYTSSLNTQSNLDLNNQNLNSILNNNNLDNITINELDSNNKTSNTDKFLGKKRLSKKFVKNKKTNNAYKYLFNDDNNKYFGSIDGPTEVSNPEYKQFMENVYYIFKCLSNFIFKSVFGNKSQILKEIKVSIKQVEDIAKLFDKFKFPDNKISLFANNSVSNLSKYIKEHKDVLKSGISFYDSYINYLRNHIIKLYNQTTNALKKSIYYNEDLIEQINIVEEFYRISKDVMNEISSQALNEEYYINGKQIYSLEGKMDINEFRKYSKILSDIENDIEEYIEENDIQNELLPEFFCCYRDNFQERFDNIHDELTQSYLNKLNNNNENIIISTINNEKLKHDNKKQLDILLDKLDIANDTKVLNCKDFLINGRKDITIKKYLSELKSNLDILRNITDQKIQYQLQHERIITFRKSVDCYQNIIWNVFNNIENQFKENNEQLYNTLLSILLDICEELMELRYDDSDYSCNENSEETNETSHNFEDNNN